MLCRLIYQCFLHIGSWVCHKYVHNILILFRFFSNDSLTLNPTFINGDCESFICIFKCSNCNQSESDNLLNMWKLSSLSPIHWTVHAHSWRRMTLSAALASRQCFVRMIKCFGTAAALLSPSANESRGGINHYMPTGPGRIC